MTDTNETCYYLEAAPADQGTTLTWLSPAYYFAIISGTAQPIGTGRRNTALILAMDENAPAAKACKDYNNGGKTDWFLPSRLELNELYGNRSAVGNLGTSQYWASSQAASQYEAWYQRFSDGSQNYDYKDSKFSVRAVRAFYLFGNAPLPGTELG
jgi:hypothetical protein